MAQYDLIKKMIEDTARVLAKLLFNIENTNDELNLESKNEFNNFISDEFNFRLDDFIQLNDLDFLSNLKKSKKLNEENLEILSDLLFHLGIKDNKLQKNKKIQFLKKSKLILEYKMEAYSTFSFDSQNKIILVQNEILKLAP